jgi:DNA-binding NarL/FixJ family response regulator
MMSSIRIAEPIRVGVLTDEPIRLEGLASVFEDRPGEGYAPLSPVTGKIKELLSDTTLEYLVVDLISPSGGIETLEAIRRKRPDLRLIVLGPEGNDDLVLESIMAGARAYLDLKAGPRIVRQAVEVVTSGAIWAPRRLLSTLIDRLLWSSDTSLTNAPPHLTDRERQVLELILTARSNREIARQLGIEERTVQAHVGRLMRKTGTNNRIDLSMRALSDSLLPGPGNADRRAGDRRTGDRRQGLPLGPRPVTHK